MENTNAGQKMLLLAAITTKEQLAEILKKSITNWSVMPEGKEKEECWTKLEFDCSLILAKAMAPNIEEALKIGAEMDMQVKQMNSADSVFLSNFDKEAN